MMDARLLSQRLKESVDWNLFFTLVECVGAGLNSPKLRFLKSDFLEMAVSQYSDGSVEWVDQVGFDHLFKGELKLEMKHHEGSLHKKNGQRKECLGSLRMKNTLGGGELRTLDKTFDFLLVTDRRSAALVDFDLLRDSCRAAQDAIVVKSGHLSSDRIHFIVEPCEVDVQSVGLPSFQDELRRLQSSYLDRLKGAHSQQKAKLF